MNVFYNALFKKLDYLAEHPEKVSQKEADALDKVYGLLEKVLGISESGKWCVEWKVDKYEDEKSYKLNKPYATELAKQNVILNTGAEQMLKVVCGISADAYDTANAKIGVGTSTTSENASQTGLVATSREVAYKQMEVGYPKVNGRTMVFKSVFGEEDANFAWNEFTVVNGTGVGGIALNRKVQALGTKTTGIWSIQITITVSSNT